MLLPQHLAGCAVGESPQAGGSHRHKRIQGEHKQCNTIFLSYFELGFLSFAINRNPIKTLIKIILDKIKQIKFLKITFKKNFGLQQFRKATTSPQFRLEGYSALSTSPSVVQRRDKFHPCTCTITLDI